MHIGSKVVADHIRPERIAGRRVLDDTPVSLADLVLSYVRRTNAARIAAEEAQEAADALNEALRLAGGRDASTALDGWVYQHSLGGLRVGRAIDPSSRVPS